MIKQFPLRRLFSVVTIICILLAIFRRPIIYLLKYDYMIAFVAPFQHLGWLMGFNVDYSEIHRVLNLPSDDVIIPIVLTASACISVLFHILLMYLFVCAIEMIWNWGGKE